MERTFLIVGHRVRTDAKFSLNDLCGSTGRLDILLRTINSSFLLSNGIRRNVTLYLVLQGEPDAPISICLKGPELRYLNPDERSTGALIRQALLTKGISEEWKRSTPGIYIAKREYDDLLMELIASGKRPVYLHETGVPLSEANFPNENGLLFLLGDQFDLTEEEEQRLQEISENPVGKISLGPEILHTDHCVILIHNALDRQEE
jgi:tRNA (pseudouridine54-N1)-methyltransferase